MMHDFPVDLKIHRKFDKAKLILTFTCELLAPENLSSMIKVKEHSDQPNLTYYPGYRCWSISKHIGNKHSNISNSTNKRRTG